jgi:hypothetical protein
VIAFSPEQEQFRKTVARFVDAEVVPAADGIDARGEFPAALFKRVGELGYLGLRYPEAYGGADADMTTYCLFAEEIEVIVLCGALEWQQRDAIMQYVKRHWGTPIVMLSPAKPNSIQNLLRALASSDEEQPRAA